MNINCAANYYDLKSSEAYPVSLSAGPNGLTVVGQHIEMVWPVREIHVSERLGKTPRTIRHLSSNGESKESKASQGFCEIQDLAALDSVLKALNHQPNLLQSWLDLAHHNLLMVAISAIFFVGLLVVSYLYGLPMAAQTIALQLPEASLKVLDSGTLEQLEKYGVLTPSKLTVGRQQALILKFSKLVMHNSRNHIQPKYSIVFRQSKAFGANAFALPSGTIILLDDLANLATDDNEIMGVLAHELGHVQRRHAARLLLQTSTVGLAATWWLGDISTLLAAVPATLLGAKYSRDMEREADLYGITLMLNSGLSPCYLANILDKLERNLVEKKASLTKTSAKNQTHTDVSDASDYLASHPATPERMRLLCPTQ